MFNHLKVNAITENGSSLPTNQGILTSSPSLNPSGSAIDEQKSLKRNASSMNQLSDHVANNLESDTDKIKRTKSMNLNEPLNDKSHKAKPLESSFENLLLNYFISIS